MKKKIIRIIIFLAAAAALIYGATVAAVILFSFKNYSGKADAALVFGAAQWNNRPSPVLKERINHSINLLKKGNVKYIFFSGGYGKNSRFSESSVSRDYAIKQGIAADSIIIENISNSTIENIYYASKIGKEYGISSYALVSDPEHILRCAVLARYFKMNYYVSPTRTTKIKGWKRKLKFASAEAYYIIKFSVSAYIFKSDVLRAQLF